MIEVQTTKVEQFYEVAVVTDVFHAWKSTLAYR